jgi:hypothetical protein
MMIGPKSVQEPTGSKRNIYALLAAFHVIFAKVAYRH